MQSEIISLNEINKSIVIPIYQRLYEWDTWQIRTLLDDILSANKEYFIGTITASIEDDKDDELVIIDGQQRFSTIFFLCAYMCYENNKMMKAEGEFANAFNFAYLENECRFKMPLREDIVDAIWDYDFHNLGENIDNAFKTFKEYFKDNDKSKLNENLFQNIRINLVILDGINCGNYFINMNSNYQALDESDILKSYLLKLVKDDEKYFEYSSILNECMQMNKIADFDTEYEVLCIGEILKKDIKEYKTKEFKSIVDYPTFVLHVFRILSKDNKNIFFKDKNINIDKTKLLENTWEKIKHSKENAIKIINALKEYRIIFDTFVIKKQPKDNDEAYYEFYDDKGNELDFKNLATIQNYLRVARRGDNANYHHFLTHYLEFCKNEIIKERKEITNENCLEILKINTDKLKGYLKNLDTALAYKSLEEDNINSLLDIADDFKNENKNYDLKDNCFNFLNNGTNTSRYWFYRLEYYLLTDENFKEKHKDDTEKYRFRYVNSVEHVLAQNDVSGLAKQEENQEVLDNFGNLALITDGENSGFSNKPFNEKQSQFDSYLKKGLVISLKLLDIYKNEEYQKDENGNKLISQIWQKEQIEDHQKAMLEVLQNSFLNSQENLK